MEMQGRDILGGKAVELAMNNGLANDRVPQDLNRFSYVLNNPLNRVDVDGYGFWKWVKKFVLKVLSSVISIVMRALFMAILPIRVPGFGLSDAFWDSLGQMAANPFVIGADAAIFASTQRHGGVGFHGYLTGARTTLFGLTAGLAAIAVGAMQGKNVGIHAESVGGTGVIVFSGVGFVMGKASAQTIGHAMLLKVERNGIRKGWNFHDWVSHESLDLQQAGVLRAYPKT